MDDVDRISWGKNAKKKGTGSRGVPHRLNDEERTLYDFARAKGFVEIAGSGWRKQRSASPLVNTYRSWCDARGVPAVYLHKGSEGIDEVVVDLSPLRVPDNFGAASAYCLQHEPGGIVEVEGVGLHEESDSTADAYATEPIYRIPMHAVSWVCTRPDAKALAKRLAILLGTAETTKGRQKVKGAPNVKPGKSRRHGGYGIG